MARRASTSVPFHVGRVRVEENGPTFFKIINPGFNTEHIRIPPAFRKHVSHELTPRATLKLKNSSDSSWTVKVSRAGRDIFLENGWEDFLRDNCLGDCEFLVLRYDKNMQFTVTIFDKNCLERVHIPDLRPRQPHVIPDNAKRHVERAPTGYHHRYDLAAEAAHVLKTKGDHLPCYPAAAAFTSRRPYFAKVVAGSRMVAIPTHFYKTKISSKYHELYLVTSKGKFKVSLLKCTDTKMLSEGWSFFRNENDLKVDDICIFELMKKTQWWFTFSVAD